MPRGKYPRDTDWRARADAAGYPQPTDAQIVARWTEHPELYEDLCRVLGGFAQLWTISAERHYRKRAG